MDGVRRLIELPLPVVGWGLIAGALAIVMMVVLSVVMYARNDALELAGFRFGAVDAFHGEGRIVMAVAECSTLGPGWVPHSGLAGRFPVGAGAGTDESDVQRNFVLDQVGGEYEHTLTLSEIPPHQHSDDRVVSHNRRCDGNCSSLVREGSSQTGESGDGDAHNNIPPFRVVNFCTRDRLSGSE